MKNEATTQAEIRLAAAEAGLHLFRNNSGVAFDKTGRPVRFGLGNDSAEINSVIKSGDLIGWREVTITADMVGQTVAQFVSVECKGESARNRAVPKPQQTWADLVKGAGGLGVIVFSAVEFVGACKLRYFKNQEGVQGGAENEK